MGNSAVTTAWLPFAVSHVTARGCITSTRCMCHRPPLRWVSTLAILTHARTHRERSVSPAATCLRVPDHRCFRIRRCHTGSVPSRRRDRDRDADATTVCDSVRSGRRPMSMCEPFGVRRCRGSAFVANPRPNCWKPSSIHTSAAGVSNVARHRRTSRRRVCIERSVRMV